MFENAPKDSTPKDLTPKDLTKETAKPNSYQKEADALAVALGLKTLDVEIRDGVTITLREFELQDLSGLYNWLGELRAMSQGLKASGDSLGQEQRKGLMDVALTQGVDLLSICSDGKIPKGTRLPLSVAARLTEGLLEVNQDFFTAWPQIQGLMTDIGAMLNPNAADGTAGSMEPSNEPPQPAENGQKS